MGGTESCTLLVSTLVDHEWKILVLAELMRGAVVVLLTLGASQPITVT